ncbi:phage tail protein [Vibrio parahaemolyticus]|nr:phage tail protein [Vibrio parahaemolyticus]
MFWFFMQIVISLAISLLLAPKPSFDEAKAATLEQWNFPTAEDRAIPVIWGKVLYKAMNDVWHGDYEARPIKKKMKTGMFSSKNVIVGYEYFLGMMAALCWGDDTLRLHNIYSGENKVSPLPEGGWDGKEELQEGSESFYIGAFTTVDILGEKTFFEKIEGMKGYFSFRNGHNNTQSSYLAKHLEINPVYEGLAYVIFEKFMWGEGASLKALSFELSRYPKNTLGQLAANCQIGDDANPAFIVFEVLTNTQWGMGMESTLLDVQSFEVAAQTLYEESMGVSLTADTTATANTMIAEVLRTVDGCIVLNSQTGQYEFRLVREGYDIDNLKVLDESNVVEVRDYSRAALDKLMSEVRVSFKSRANMYETRSVATQNLGVFHSRNTSEFKDSTYNAVTSVELANRLAMRDLVAASSDLASLEIVCTREAADLNVGDVFIFKFAPLSIEQQVYRVTSVDYGTIRNGMVTLTATADVFGMMHNSYSNDVESEYSTFSRMPIAANNIEFIEAPYWLGQDAARFYACVERPSTAESSFELMVRDLGLTAYSDVEGPYAFTQRATVSGAAGNIITLDSDYTPYVEVASDEDLKQGVNLCLIISDQGQEWVSIKSATYDLTTQTTSCEVWRGCLDTVPKAHVGGVMWFVDEAGQIVDYDFDVASELMVRTRTQVSLQEQANASVRAVNITNRRNKPLPAASVQASFLNGVQVSWVRKGYIHDVQPFDSQADVDSGWSYEVSLIDSNDAVVATSTVASNQVTFADVLSLDGLRVKIVTHGAAGESEAVIT